MAVGKDALGGDTLGGGAVAVGKDALKVQNFTTATTNYNVAVGLEAGAAITTGSRTPCSVLLLEML